MRFANSFQNIFLACRNAKQQFRRAANADLQPLPNSRARWVALSDEGKTFYPGVGADEMMAALYSLKAIRSGAYDDPEVFANDVIVVGDSQARRIFKDVLQASPLITTPLLILFRTN